MIIFGTRGKVLNSRDNTATFNCSHCNSANTVNSFQSFRYFHIFWIPVFPYSNSIVTQCSHCKSVKYQKELNSQELDKIKSKTNTKVPFGYFTGLILIGLFISAVIISIIASKS